MIVLEMKCPQLSKPEATAARNENSIGDRMEKKTLGETRLSRGGSSPLARRTSSLFQLQQSQSVSGPLVPGVFPRWMSRWRGPHWRSVSGAHLGGPRRGCHRLFSGVRSSLSFKGRIQTEACVIPNYLFEQCLRLSVGALPLSVCLFKMNRFMYSPIVSRFG